MEISMLILPLLRTVCASFARSSERLHSRRPRQADRLADCGCCVFKQLRSTSPRRRYHRLSIAVRDAMRCECLGKLFTFQINHQLTHCRSVAVPFIGQTAVITASTTPTRPDQTRHWLIIIRSGVSR
uniref:Putative secreted protein n=1 Tax=Anopheles marajoara TaxID=58244 RepID=A0A2M4C714_9DIPT